MDYKNNPKRTMNKERAKKFTAGFLGKGSLKDKMMSGLGLKSNTANAAESKKKKSGY